MERREELLRYVCPEDKEKELYGSVIDDFIFLENRLDELKQLPFIRINPLDPSQQKATPAAKLYKELLQQYTNILKVLTRATDADESDEESPLRKWVKSRMN